ncbi:hypothetical protein BJV82DRAFT_636377 [Fennellomyces sp. T-0311]|nr:hypothetical protein BJV82DRAFT_636377 [Fennellomyces sp. T-0311]
MEWATNYVQEKKNGKKRMNWSVCFEEGQKLGYFKAFSNATSLKSTFNAKKNRK